MKKVFLVFALAMGLTAVKAQDTKPVSFGVKAGVNLANLRYDYDGESESGDMKFGFHVGGFARFAISESLAFQPELLFSTEGSKDEDEDFDYKTVMKLNYIHLPLILQYQTGGFTVDFGPGFGALMSAKAKVEVDDEEAEEDIKEMFEGLNITGNVGVGYVMPNGLGFGARYVHGFSNILKDGGDEKVKTSNFQISLFKRF